MAPLSQVLVTLGCIFLASLAIDALGRRTRLPRVTLLLLLGFGIGPAALDLLPDLGMGWFPSVAHIALAMVGFLLGERLTASDLRGHGRVVLWISVCVALLTATAVFLGLLALGFSVVVALLLGGIAPATAPAATADVVREARADGEFSRTLLGVVAVDDAWGLLLFGLAIAAATAVVGDGSFVDVLGGAGVEVGGSLLLGLTLGVPMAYLTGRVRPGEPTLAEALGGVFLCAGLAVWLELSFLLASMALGATVANLARHHERPFHAIEEIEWPFMVVFFVLSGAALRVDSLPALGALGGAYVLLRAASRLLGAWVGTVASGVDGAWRRWMGAALMPQAGVALGLALVASQRFPDVAEMVLPVVIAATVLFEVLGPVLTRAALERVGEVRLDEPS